MVPIMFDLDCGDVLGGHRLIATGIRVDGASDDRFHADYSEHVEGKPVCPMVSLTYRITPALPEPGDGRDIYATVRLDPAPDPAFWHHDLAPGAERVPGVTSTEAAVGPFALPDDTERITVHLVEADLTAGAGRASSKGADRDLGEVVVDLPTGAARWQPALQA
jgi:hypothetical protein